VLNRALIGCCVYIFVYCACMYILRARECLRTVWACVCRVLSRALIGCCVCIYVHCACTYMYRATECFCRVLSRALIRYCVCIHVHCACVYMYRGGQCFCRVRECICRPTHHTQPLSKRLKRHDACYATIHTYIHTYIYIVLTPYTPSAAPVKTTGHSPHGPRPYIGYGNASVGWG